MNNIYVQATKENLSKLLKKGCVFGINTEKALLEGEYIAVNGFQNMFSFSKEKCLQRKLNYQVL